MDMTEAVRDQIISKASSSAIKATASQSGFKTLRQEGLVKAAAGLTTVEEVLRVTQEAEGMHETSLQVYRYRYASVTYLRIMRWLLK